MKKNIFLTLIALMCAACTYAYFESGDLYYNFAGTSTGTSAVTVYGLSGNYSERRSVIIPERITYNGHIYSVTSIGQGAFKGCSSLTSITIPNSVTSIRNSAFEGCSGLTSIIIPNSVTSIGYEAFSFCSGLTSITVESGNTVYDSRNNCNAIIKTETNTLIVGCQNTTIPNSVTSIGENAFLGCSSLTSITIPNSVTSIGKYAFSHCRGLTSITVESSNSVYDSRNKCNAIIETATNTLIVACPNTTIPNSVTSIGDYAFRDCSGLTSITIPNSITSIESYTFENCSDLTSITIPNSVTSIGDYAFRNCSDLTSITIPNSVTSIGKYAFSDCSGLTSITIPNSVTSIGKYAFSHCRGLTSVVWNAKNCADFSENETPFSYDYFSGVDVRPQITSFVFGDSVQHIPANICSGMNNLMSITIPNSVTSIGDYAFSGCRSLTKTNYTGSIADWCRINFAKHYNTNPIYYSHNLFINDVLVTDLVIPDGITTINDYALSYDTCLTSVTIPNSVTSIGYYVFSGCSNLTSVVWNAKNCTDSYSIGTLFDNDSQYDLHPQITSFVFGDSVQYIPAHICSGMNDLTFISISNSVTKIGESAFSGCSSLTSIVIPNSVTSISRSAFNGCSGLTSITIPNSVTNIGNSVFADCSGLTSITLGNNVTNIGDSAFYKCSGLTSVTIPNNVMKIGELVFYGCSGLKSIVWNAKNCTDFSSISTPFYYGDSFSKKNNLCPQITSFVFGDSVQHIPAWICSEMNNFTSITIPNSVTSIGNGAFSDCRNLTSVTIPNCVTSIGNHAFLWCTGLTSVTIGNSVTRIGISAFDYCRNLTSITIPHSVTSIERRAFADCHNLTSINIPDSVVSIGKEAFKNCRNIASITIPNSVTSIEDNAFFDVLNIAYSGTATGAPWGARCMNGYVDGYLVYADAEKTNLLACSRTATGAITIPNSVTSIEDKAFYKCSGLTSVTIPNSVMSIGDSAFDGCSGLTKTKYTGSIADWCKITFAGYSSTPVYYSHNLFINDVLITDLVIPEGITTINNYTLCFDTCLTSVTIPNSVTSIGSNAFSACTGLTSITIPNSVTTIGAYAFSGCTGLTSITIPNSVTAIGAYAFSGCTGLTSITIPSSVTSIGNAFDGCSGLTKTNYTGSIADWCGINFVNEWSNPVYYSHNLFINDVLITDLVIPDGVTTINDFALIYDTCLTSVSIPNSVTSIGDGAFSSCSSLTSVTIGNSVTNIGDMAFYNCSGLTSITIGNGVASIGDWAFADCNRIRDITFKSSMPLECCSKNKAFRDCYNIENVHVPCGSKSNYVYAGWKETILTEVAPTVFVATEDITRGTAKVDKQALLCDDYTIISATPTEYCHFTQWNDGNTDNPRTIFATEDVTYTARFALNQYTITTSADDGNVSGAGTYDYGTEVTLTATPNDRYRFTQWSDGNTENPRTVVVSGNATYTAEFIALYEISTVYDQARGDVSGAGTYDYGTEATLTATPAEHYHFTQWSDGYTDNPRTIRVTKDAIYVAEFSLDQYTITASADYGDVSGAGTYDYGSEITLTAIPNIGYHFMQWSDGNTENPRTVRVTEDATYTAEFALNQYTITISADYGDVSGAGTYDYGTVITLTAIPNIGYHFMQWSDGNTDNPRQVVVEKDAMFTAEFDIDTYNITVVCNTQEGRVTGSGEYDYGTQVQLEASANSGYKFSQWSNGITDNPYIFTATEDLTLEALFLPTTAVENTSAEDTKGVQKILHNGQIYILRDGKTYDIVGDEVNREL